MALVQRLNHVEIIIPRGSEDQAREFYCKFLGLTEVPKPADLQKNGGIWLTLAGLQIHLSIQDGYDPGKTKAHIAYEVASLSDMKQALAKRGLSLSDNTPVPGFIRGETRDPFGNRIEFLQVQP